MELLSPIPSPPAQRWRQVRLKVLQLGAFLAVCVGVAIAWRNLAHPISFLGQAELIQAAVTSPDAGLLTNLWVNSFQAVKAGDLVAEVITTDPRTADVRLEVLRDRMRLIELEMNPILMRQRSAVEYERLGVECARVKVELAMAQANLVEASNEFQRVSQLFQEKDKLVSDTEYGLAKARFEALRTQVEEDTKLVLATRKTLERLSFMADAYTPGGENDPLKQALAMEEQKMKVFEQKMKPLQLLAPISGTVTVIQHQAGEQILAGVPLVTITSHESQRIVGFLPPGFPITPKLGMPVEVRTRGLKRLKAEAKITGVGPHLQSITNFWLTPPISVRPIATPAIGRPVSISLPAPLHLMPGEIVEVTIKR